MRAIMKAAAAMVVGFVTSTVVVPDANAMMFFLPDVTISRVAPFGNLLVVQVKNLGLASSPATYVRMRINGSGARYVEVPALAPGAKATISFEVGSGTIWSCHNEFNFDVDPRRAIRESNETNNEKGFYGGPC